MHTRVMGVMEVAEVLGLTCMHHTTLLLPLQAVTLGVAMVLLEATTISPPLAMEPHKTGATEVNTVAGRLRMRMGLRTVGTVAGDQQMVGIIAHHLEKECLDHQGRAIGADIKASNSAMLLTKSYALVSAYCEMLPRFINVPQVSVIVVVVSIHCVLRYWWWWSNR